MNFRELLCDPTNNVGSLKVLKELLKDLRLTRDIFIDLLRIALATVRVARLFEGVHELPLWTV